MGGVGLVVGDRVGVRAWASDRVAVPDLLQNGDERRAAGVLSGGQGDRVRAALAGGPVP